ncbi:hypothetical protein Poly24_25750 [Rosistilla carotiformis]|uniref:Uncharacterized protein n=1 Tax=Rosistilla carotiformis TaxID=2528017 RepID=A0A518JTI5_9BACT|nr:hypothetical protein [Rosistilla carotiformis]QDV68862.1 hypothetical protein Poly24_25750 [Rosistilla carotiformis]
MKKPAAKTRRPFRIESLESRSMLAGDVVSFADGLLESDRPNNVRPLGTVDVRVADSVMTYEVFSARGFRSVPPSDARPDWHNHPNGNGAATYSATPQFTFVALPELRARLLTSNPSPNNVQAVQFDWNDSLWNGPQSLNSSGSKPLPVHADSGSSLNNSGTEDAMTEQASNSEADSEASPIHSDGDATAHPDPVATATPVADDDASDGQTAARIDRAILEWSEDETGEFVDAETGGEGRDSIAWDALDWSESLRAIELTGSKSSPFSALGVDKQDGFLRSDYADILRGESDAAQRWQHWHRSGDRFGDALDRWIVQPNNGDRSFTQIVHDQMIDLTAGATTELVGMAISYGGMNMTQLFVEADAQSPGDEGRNDPSQLAIVFESLAATNHWASAVGVIAVASCLSLRRRTQTNSEAGQQASTRLHPLGRRKRDAESR